MDDGIDCYSGEIGINDGEIVHGGTNGYFPGFIALSLSLYEMGSSSISSGVGSGRGTAEGERATAAAEGEADCSLMIAETAFSYVT